IWGVQATLNSSTTASGLRVCVPRSDLPWTEPEKAGAAHIGMARRRPYRWITLPVHQSAHEGAFLITEAILEAFLKCPLTAHYLLSGSTPSSTNGSSAYTPTKFDSLLVQSYPLKRRMPCRSFTRIFLLTPTLWSVS